jgi:putative Flp pilus-assembly TadE/G-like protein
MNRLVRIRRSRSSGQTALIMLLAMPTLLGALALGVDVTMMYFNWEQLQKAADAAALAGASSLPGDPTGATAAATLYALSNGVQQGEIVSTQVASDDLSITVSLQRSVPYHFGAVLGLTQQQVKVAATAAIQQNPDNASGLIPVGLSCDSGEGQGDCAYQAGTMYQLKGSQVGPGNWAPIELGGTPGANAYRNYMEIGYTGDIPQQVPTEPGNTVGPTGQAVASRISKGMGINPTATYSDPPAYDPRLVVVPLIQFNDANGKTPVTVVGYALGWLDSTTGNNDTINMYFEGFLSQPTSDSSTTAFGLNTPILIH